MRTKKGVINQIVSVFILMLVIAVLAGLSFLFISSLKDNTVTTTTTSGSVINDSLSWTLDAGNVGARLSASSNPCFKNAVLIGTVWNGTDALALTNFTISDDGVYVRNTSTESEWGTLKISYTYDYCSGNAYSAVNATEEAGYTTVNYLGLIFLALIFGALLTLVLKVILPYINLGSNMGGF